MISIQRIFAKGAAKAAIGLLDVLEWEYRSQSLVFDTLRTRIARVVLSKQRDFEFRIKANKTPLRVAVYNMLCHYATDLLLTGAYHIYRGELTSLGEDVLYIFKDLQAKLVKENAITQDICDSNIKYILKNISMIG